MMFMIIFDDDSDWIDCLDSVFTKIPYDETTDTNTLFENRRRSIKISFK